jgi:hypothetical protein
MTTTTNDNNILKGQKHLRMIQTQATAALSDSVAHVSAAIKEIMPAAKELLSWTPVP